MTWTTKKLDTDKNYVVIKHKLSGINGFLCGVKFRNGYGVVVVGSKAYKQLKMLPFLKDAPEYPLIFLRKLPFVTRDLDIKMIYGQDVYYYYYQQLQEAQKQEAEVKQEQKEEQHIDQKCCAYRTKTGELCKMEALKKSPSGYCKMHILKDPELIKYGIKVPERLTFQERSEWKDKVINKLERVKLVGQ